MQDKVVKAAAKATGTAVAMYLGAAVIGKLSTFVFSEEHASNLKSVTFTVGMIGAGAVADDSESEYKAATIAIGATYGIAATAAYIAKPDSTVAPARGLSSPQPPVINASYEGTDDRGIPVYTAKYA